MVARSMLICLLFLSSLLAQSDWRIQICRTDDSGFAECKWVAYREPSPALTYRDLYIAHSELQTAGAEGVQLPLGIDPAKILYVAHGITLMRLQPGTVLFPTPCSLCYQISEDRRLRIGDADLASEQPWAIWIRYAAPAENAPPG